MIADYEALDRDELLSSPGIYGLTLNHKHIPEMQKYTGLNNPPVFMPVVDDYYKGMATTIMLHNNLLNGKPSAKDICEKLSEYYKDEHFVRALPGKELPDVKAVNGSNYIDVNGVYDPDTGLIKLFSAQDNLGKGAALQAIQAFNAMFSLPEQTGLNTVIRGV